MSSYVIGIDLGTTNCTLAFASSTEPDQIHQFPISQFIEKEIEGAHFSFPSFIYLPLQEEIHAGFFKLSGFSNQNLCLGTYAAKRGGETAGRVITSAKSWLCHHGIDRRQPLLPLDCAESDKQISPFESIVLLLRHLREAWDRQMPEAPFIEQKVLITVPASFDPSACQLVNEAAQAAGYGPTILLEEPQAAFYAWLQTHSNSWRKQLKEGDSVLVVDVGGGTTDFSLIKVVQENGDLHLQRMAVGDHLLLGGDNMDFSLAYLVKEKLENQGHSLSEWQMQTLVHACRNAKERLLSDHPPEQIEITIQGRGTKLIGGQLTSTLTKEEVQNVITDGFFPLIDPQESSPPEKRAGFQSIGLPYAQDARISSQLAKFLALSNQNKDAIPFALPSAVLFNGGAFKASSLRKRFMDILDKWSAKLQGSSVRLLDGADYDFAVSRGAVVYGFAREGQSIRIKSGVNRSYFIGIEEAAPSIPGIPTPIKAVCVVPMGMEEGSQQMLENQEFFLTLGELASFRFFCSTTSAEIPHMGMVMKNWKQGLQELHPIEILLDKLPSDGRNIKVKLQSHVTEMGMLELWCVAADGRQWKLEFALRNPQEQLIS